MEVTLVIPTGRRDATGLGSIEWDGDLQQSRKIIKQLTPRVRLLDAGSSQGRLGTDQHYG